MKKYIYIIGICFSSFLISCEDFLTVESPDKLTSSTFWRDKSDAEAGLAAAYSQLENNTGTWSMPQVKWPVEAFRADLLNLGDDAATYPSWVQLYDFSYTNGNSQLALFWSCNYRGISFSSQVIEKVIDVPADKMTEAERTQLANEAHFLRAYYHIKLLLNWEQIIVQDKYITSQAELNKPLSTRQEAWEFIISDLEKATGLPAEHKAENMGRATKGAAYSYLGLCYLTRAYEETASKTDFLEKANTAFSELKTLGVYSLEKDFPSMFDGTNKNCAESIFELQLSMNTTGGAYHQNQMHKWIGAKELGGWDEVYPNDFLMETFMKEGKIATTGHYDTRLYETACFDDAYFNDSDNKILYGFTYDELFEESTAKHPIFLKHLPSTLETLTASRSAMNLPLMRYANVLLMQAEALNELGRAGEAIPLINEVRSAHGDMPAMTGTTQEQVRAQIEHERIIEFPLENWRWYDLRRWGKLETVIGATNRGFDINKHSFYPVPLGEINANAALQGTTE